MKYLCMIFDNETSWQTLTKEEAAERHRAYGTFTQEIIASGHMINGEALQPTSTATTVRVRDGKISTTDGPFVETKEQLGGYYLVDARDLNEAIQIAARIPGAWNGAIEVRPIMDTTGM
jgi:hypothetical protein